MGQALPVSVLFLSFSAAIVELREEQEEDETIINEIFPVIISGSISSLPPCLLLYQFQ